MRNIQTVENFSLNVAYFLASEKRRGYPRSEEFSGVSCFVLGKPTQSPQSLTGKTENYLAPPGCNRTRPTTNALEVRHG